MKHPTPTHYFDDFLEYYARAQALEQMNHFGKPRKPTGDGLQDNVSIYDTVHRKYAGFSHVLRDLKADKRTKVFTLTEWLWLYGVHRFTGSGASFYPASEGPRRHGYCNTAMFELVEAGLKCQPGSRLDSMADALFDRIEVRGESTFTSLGNQPPPFPKPIDGYTKGGAYYMCEIWRGMVSEMATTLQEGHAGSVSTWTDWLLDYNVANGCKKFKFTMTAFIMDIADWHPALIDPSSECYYGENCIRAFNAMFSYDNNRKRVGFYHECMEHLRSVLHGAHPMDLEDAVCDAVRYWLRFVPRHGYSHLQPDQITTLSRIDVRDFMQFVSA